jgi:multicomponent Na+:H+ antiporter subunit C
MIEFLLDRGPYLLVVLLAVVGAYLMMSRRTLLKAVVGLYVFQTSVILLFVALSYRAGATVPVVLNDLPMHNPLPHAMMLTAIVVGVATVGLAVAILRRIQDETGSIEDSDR